MASRNQPPKVQNKPNNQTQQGQILTTAQQWSGPLPPPGALQQFDAIIPNGAERIMVMVEREQEHRLSQELTVLNATVADNRRGNWMGWTISIAAIVAAAGTAYLGAHPTVSIALVSLPIVTIVQAFIRGKPGK